MGTDYRTLVCPSLSGDALREQTSSWMRRKGYGLVDKPIFPCREHERSALIFSSEKVSVIAYSDFEEERRLAWELSRQHPVVSVWCHDSDLWGWSIIEDCRATSEFSRKTSGFRPESYFPDEPPPDDIYEGDPERLCSVLGRPELSEQVRKLQRKKQVFQERTVEELAVLLGIGAAATQFRYCVAGDPVPGEWAIEHCVWTREERPPKFDLHSAQHFRFEEPKRAPPPESLERPKLSFGFRAMLFLFAGPARLLGWLAARRAVRETVEDSYWRSSSSYEPPGAQIEGQRLINRRHGFYMDLQNELRGLELIEEGGPYVSEWLLFSGRLPDDRVITSSPLDFRDRRAFKAWGAVKSDERFEVNGRKARVVLEEHAHRDQAYPVVAGYLQGDRAVYRIGCGTHRPEGEDTKRDLESESKLVRAVLAAMQFE